MLTENVKKDWKLEKNMAESIFWSPIIINNTNDEQILNQRYKMNWKQDYLIV